MISELSLSGPNAHSAIELTIRLILSKAPQFKYVPRTPNVPIATSAMSPLSSEIPALVLEANDFNVNPRF